MKLNRRQFAASSLAALAMGGIAQRALASAKGGLTYRNQVPGYGPLVADAAGYFDLPEGFSYRIVSRAGDVLDDGFITPDHFDGMGCIALEDGRLALVRNHEIGTKHNLPGATGGRADLEEKLAALPVFGHDDEGRVMPGGTTTLVYDPATGQIAAQYLSLAGTAVNCAGGTTPWGSWLSCEETVETYPERGQSHGWVFEVPAAQGGLADPVPLKAMGRFRHEAVVIDPATGMAYLTEDEPDGLLYRFIPNTQGKLAEGGRLQALALADGITDSRNWHRADLAPGAAHAVRWIDLDEPESPNGDLRLRGHGLGAVLFARGEGIHLGERADGRTEIFFTCTSGGAGRYGQIFRYVPGADEGTPQEGDGTGQLDLFVESADPQLMDYADNIAVTPWGHLIVCEDRTGGKINHLRGVTPAGEVYTIARLNADTELAGACFLPDGETLFVNAYAPGRTLAITGPWRALL